MIHIYFNNINDVILAKYELIINIHIIITKAENL